MISKEQLKQIVVTATQTAIDTYYSELVATMTKYEITNNLRIAAFIAQIAHESGAFKYNKELWGPTTQQLKYEPPSKLATDLGNINTGDGVKYKGRGFIQITGRSNYTKIAKELNVDCVNHPELLEQPKYVCLTAGWFWNDKKLNPLADEKKFIEITKKINGGTNGFKDRDAYYMKALEILK